MINKRLLIKNLLGYNDENSFYDRKELLDLSNRTAKAKFLKHICALSNANPKNRSYIIVGIDDEKNEIKGVDFFDDSRIQNLVDAYIENPPKVQYENVAFPDLPRHKVVGLVSIFPTNKLTLLKRNIWKYSANSIFIRKGSTSVRVEKCIPQNLNQTIVETIENQARNNVELTLDGVIDFMKRHDEMQPSYRVFKDQFVLCWAGKKKQAFEKEYFTRVDIELINEQVRLFYSDMDEVKINFNNESFIITEYVPLGIHKEINYYPLEKTIFHFRDNGRYKIASEILFEPPQYNKSIVETLFNENNTILEKLKAKAPLSVLESSQLLELPNFYLICYFNGIDNAIKKLDESKSYLKALDNKTSYIKYKEAKRILRKIKYK